MLIKAIRRLRARTIDRRLIGASGLFDPAYYARAYDDVEASGLDPLQHFVEHGAAEGRDPSALFVASYYLSQYPELDPRRINPLSHYIVVGEGEGARPNPYFDPLYVRRALRLAPQHSPLRAYMKLPFEFLCDPSMEFDIGHYRKAALGDDSSVHPLAYYLRGPIVGNLKSSADVDGPVMLECRSVNDLRAEGDDHWRPTGADPYFVFGPKGGGKLPAGLYSFSFRFDGERQRLTGSTIFIDEGQGFRPDNTWRPHFSTVDGQLTCMIELKRPVFALRFDVWEGLDDEHGPFFFADPVLERQGRARFFRTIYRAAEKREGRERLREDLRSALSAGGLPALREAVIEAYQRGPLPHRVDYEAYVERFEAITTDDLDVMRERVTGFDRTPLISIVMPTYNTPAEFLRRCLDSVIAQTYPHWELCIADDASPKPHVAEILSEYASRDSRIRFSVREENGHISAASNTAIAMADGEWMALLDHDDELPPYALYCVADAINSQPDAALIFSDEDKINPDEERLDPYFKTDYNERLTLAQNMVSHLGVYRMDVVRDIGGFREGLEGSQDWDLMLRFVERIEPSQIVHLPFVLYHWRMLEGSTSVTVDNKHYAVQAGLRAVSEALSRRGIDAEVTRLEHVPHYYVRYALPNPIPRVAIIIPTRDGLDVLRPCIQSVLERTSYPNFEVVVVDNGSEEQATLAYLEEIETMGVTVIRDPQPFNFARINNHATRGLGADYFCFLNNDTTVITPDWLSEMVRECAQDKVGVVGAKLLYPDGTNQHAGVVLGIGGEKIAGHAFTGTPGEDPAYFGRAELPHELSAVTAACMLTRRDLFEKLGGFDAETFAVAFNDIDYCLRARKAGYKVIFTPQARLTHHESKTRGFDLKGERRKRYLTEAEAMKERWGELLSNDPFYSPNLALGMAPFSISHRPRRSFPWRNGDPS